MYFFFTFMWPCIVTDFLIIKATICTNFSNLFWKWNSTCFGKFLCPSSGVIHCTLNNSICHYCHRVAYYCHRLATTAIGWLLLPPGGLLLPPGGYLLLPPGGYPIAVNKYIISYRCVDKFRAGSGWNILILLESCLQTCMTYTNTVYTVNDSWWRTEELSETCRVSFPKQIWEISASSWFYYKEVWYSFTSDSAQKGKHAEIDEMQCVLLPPLICEVPGTDKENMFYFLRVSL